MSGFKFSLNALALIILILALGGALPQAKAQIEGDNPLEIIPSERRVRLLQRLSEAFDYLSAHELKKFYDLASVECRDRMGKEARDRKAPVNASDTLLEFSIEKVRKDSVHSTAGEQWIVSGCLKYQNGSKNLKSEATYYIAWRNNEWFVCGFKKESKKGVEVPCSS
jgi:hypothetical protein